MRGICRNCAKSCAPNIFCDLACLLEHGKRIIIISESGTLFEEVCDA